MDIAIKSTGTLIDEMLTADMKIQAGNSQAIERRHQLGTVVSVRLAKIALDKEKNRAMWKLITELTSVLKDCWDAQEVFRKFGDDVNYWSTDDIFEMACAGKDAQTYNNQRNKLIRKIDELIGETEFTQLEKSYG